MDATRLLTDLERAVLGDYGRGIEVIDIASVHELGRPEIRRMLGDLCGFERGRAAELTRGDTEPNAAPASLEPAVDQVPPAVAADVVDEPELPTLAEQARNARHVTPPPPAAAHLPAGREPDPTPAAPALEAPVDAPTPVAPAATERPASHRLAAHLLATAPATPAGQRLKARMAAAISPAAATFTAQMTAVQTAGPIDAEQFDALKNAAIAAGQDVAQAAAAEPEPRPWDLPAIRARQAEAARTTAPEPATTAPLGEQIVVEYGSNLCAVCDWIGVDAHQHPTHPVIVRIIDPAGAR